MIKKQISESNSLIECLEKIEKNSLFGSWLIDELIEVLINNKSGEVITSAVSPLRREGKRLGIKDPFPFLSPLLWATKVQQELLKTKLMQNA